MSVCISHLSELCPVESNSIIWTVNDFGKLRLNRTYFSPAFDLDTTTNRFYVTLRFEQSRTAKKRQLVVSLKQKDNVLHYFESDNDNCAVRYRIALLNDRDQHFVSLDQQALFSRTLGSLVNGQLVIAGHLLMDPSNALLTADQLRVFCEIDILGLERAECGHQSAEKPKKLTINDELAELWTSGELTDAVLIAASGRRFRTHRTLLAARSKVFAAILRHRSNIAEPFPEHSELNCEDMSEEVCAHVVQHLYTNRIDEQVMHRLAVDLLIAADKYFLASLKHQCEQHLADTLTLDSVTELQQLAQVYGATELASSCARFVARNEKRTNKSDH